MDLSDLKPSPGARHPKKRVGRGGCHGKTSCRGSNGQNARSGGGVAPGFEGGQTPWYRRLPKYRGFNNPNKVVFQLVSLGDLELFDAGTVVTPELIVESKISSRSNRPFKLVANGTLTKSLTVQVHAATQAALAAVQAVGGTVEVL